MAEIRNYTMNFSFGRSMKNSLGLTWLRQLACTEIHRKHFLNQNLLRI